MIYELHFCTKTFHFCLYCVKLQNNRCILCKIVLGVHKCKGWFATSHNEEIKEAFLHEKWCVKLHVLFLRVADMKQWVFVWFMQLSIFMYTQYACMSMTIPARVIWHNIVAWCICTSAKNADDIKCIHFYRGLKIYIHYRLLAV